MNEKLDWTPAQIDRLRQLWDEGLSTAEIGRRMAISKNAVVGKAHRLDLPGRPSPIKQRAPGAPPPPPPPARARKLDLASLLSLPQAPPMRQEAAPQPALPRPAADSRHACCWPIGDPGTAAFRFCGEHARPGRPYCPEHHAIATVSPRELVREGATLRAIEAYAAEHRVIVPAASGLTGLLIAVNNHRRAAGLTPYQLRATAAAAA